MDLLPFPSIQEPPTRHIPAKNWWNFGIFAMLVDTKPYNLENYITWPVWKGKSCEPSTFIFWVQNVFQGRKLNAPLYSSSWLAGNKTERQNIMPFAKFASVRRIIAWHTCICWWEASTTKLGKQRKRNLQMSGSLFVHFSAVGSGGWGNHVSLLLNTSRSRLPSVKSWYGHKNMTQLKRTPQLRIYLAYCNYIKNEWCLLVLLSIYTYTVCIYKYTYIHLASSIPTIRQLGSPNASSDLRPASGRAALRENLNCQLPGSSGENRFGYLESTLPPIIGSGE